MRLRVPEKSMLTPRGKLRVTCSGEKSCTRHVKRGHCDLCADLGHNPLRAHIVEALLEEFHAAVNVLQFVDAEEADPAAADNRTDKSFQLRIVSDIALAQRQARPTTAVQMGSCTLPVRRYALLCNKFSYYTRKLEEYLEDVSAI